MPNERKIPYPSKKMVEIARTLRQEDTRAEQLLWEMVRARRLAGIKFQRQKPLGTYVVDFYCHEANLIIELDGEIHNDPEQKQRDAVREQNLQSLGFNILRITNETLFNRPDTVQQQIINEVTKFR